MKIYKLVRLLIFGVLVSGCNQGSGPEKISFNRDVCETCHMTISQPDFVAEVRGSGGQRLHRFDDFGCAMKYADENNLLKDTATEIWVADSSAPGGEVRWIEARKAYFVGGEHTPMDYGFRAQSSAIEGALNFDQAVAAVSKSRTDANHSHSEVGK